MRCRTCQQAIIIYQESRVLANGLQIWIYRCPKCQTEHVARKSQWDELPIVVIMAKDDTSPPWSGQIVSSYDLLASNPDPQQHYWQQY
jgi:hypothetical protein